MPGGGRLAIEVSQVSGSGEGPTGTDQASDWLLLEVSEQPGDAPKLARKRVRRMLVVDDRLEILRVLQKGLLRAGFEVLTSEGAADALRLFEQGEEFDVLVTDLVMPKVGGSELARAARKLHPSLPILFMSGYAPERERSADLADIEVLEKPFRVSVLVDRINALVDDEVVEPDRCPHPRWVLVSAFFCQSEIRITEWALCSHHSQGERKYDRLVGAMSPDPRRLECCPGRVHWQKPAPVP